MSVEGITNAGSDAFGDFAEEVSGRSFDPRGALERAHGLKLDTAQGAGQRLADRLGRAGDGVRATLSRGADRALNGYEAAHDFMGERPLVTLATGVAIGAAAGYLIGRLLDRD